MKRLKSVWNSIRGRVLLTTVLPWALFVVSAGWLAVQWTNLGVRLGGAARMGVPLQAHVSELRVRVEQQRLALSHLEAGPSSERLLAFEAAGEAVGAGMARIWSLVDEHAGLPADSAFVREVEGHLARVTATCMRCDALLTAASRAAVDGSAGPPVAPVEREAALAELSQRFAALQDVVGADTRAGLDAAMRHHGLLLRWLVLLGGVGVAASLWATGTTWRLLAPVHQLARAAQQVAGGRLDPELPEPGSAELATLVGSFEHMLRSLRAYQKNQQVRFREQRCEELGRLAVAVSHEIRNPLATMRLGIVALRSAPHLRPVDQERLRLCDQESARLERSVNHLLEYARPPRLHCRPVALAEVARDGVRCAAAALDGCRVSCRVDVSPEIVAFCDRDRVQEVVLNLVLNAAAASPPGGTVLVTAAVAAEQDVRLTVTDQGSGLTEEVSDRAFEPFFTTRQNGNGVGLWYSRNVVEAHGGVLSLQNAPAGGTVATLSLPGRSV